MSSRYLVGIDLGTTHTVVAYTDTLATGATPRIALFEIEQLVAPGEVASRPLLPSVRYHPAPGELAATDIMLPWREPDIGYRGPPAVVGELARVLGAQVPGRLVASAKSWLSHPSVDRTEAILPWGAEQAIAKISPLRASASYLAHVRACWNRHFPDYPLESQTVTLTVPASFDEVARGLTVEAARIAGLVHVQLLEEPQAACYDWLADHRQTFGSILEGSRLLLVCDVGGGTSDFTLIKVQWHQQGPELVRIGVGKHLMLGGDNMDLALAHIAEGRLQAAGVRLGAADLSQLMQQCRVAKERLVLENAPEQVTVSVLGAGAQLIGGTRSTALGREEVRRMIVDGFFPNVAADEHPQRVRGGIVEFGLPYVADPAITRHLAAFLARHAAVCREALGDLAPSGDALAVPDTVLLNGGVFRSPMLADRMLETLGSWRGAMPKPLYNARPDLSVARGAVAYALARRGQGARIGGGSARSYFLVVGSNASERPRGVCLLPRGSEEGSEVRLHGTAFALRLGQPVQFHLVYATDDSLYRPGELVDIQSEVFSALPPVATVLAESQAGDMMAAREVTVELAALLTEVGTLELNCVATEQPARRWQLAFELRGGAAAGILGPGFSPVHARLPEAAERIERIYGRRARAIGLSEAKTLRADLERILGARESWDTPLLRELFGSLWGGARHRRRSADHERLWFNLAGFCLRPGFGYPLDDWRVQQLWSLYGQGLQYGSDVRTRSEWWTLWRRVAGGLARPAQERLLADLAPFLHGSAKARRHGTSKQGGYADMVRLVAALERLSSEIKVEVGNWLLERLRRSGESPQSWWAVGRLGARVPFYGSAHNVVPVSIATLWLKQALAVDWRTVSSAGFAATLLARLSGDRERDLPPKVRAQVSERLRAAKAPTSWVRMVSEVRELDEADEQRAFGESLPPGLRLIH